MEFAVVFSTPRPGGLLKSVPWGNGVNMTPQDLPPIELLEDILLPLKWTIDRIYWWGFKDGVTMGGVAFFVLFLLTNRRSA